MDDPPSRTAVLGMKAEQRPWTIHLHAKAKCFDLKLKATRFLPTCCNFFQFSFLLMISPLLIRVNADNHQTRRRKSLKSNITGVFEKFRSRPMKRKAVAVQKPSRIKRLRWVSCEGSICGSTMVIGSLALLIQSISENDTKRIIVYCLSILLYLLMRLKTFIGTKTNKILLILITAMAGYPVWLHMKNHSSYNKKASASRYIWKSCGFLHAVAQVI